MKFEKLVSVVGQDLPSRFGALALKLGAFVGGVCTVWYSIRIGHFPQDLSIGDSVLLLLVATSFGTLYLLFVASFLSTGMLFIPLARLFVRLVPTRLTVKLNSLLPKFEVGLFIFSLPAFLVVYVAWNKSGSAVLPLLFSTLGLYSFYLLYRGSTANVLELTKLVGGVIQHKEFTYKEQRKLSSNNAVRLFSAGFILFVPLFLSGGSGQLLDAAMRLASIRIESATIYLQEPYYSVVAQLPGLRKTEADNSFKRMEKVRVLMRGVGKVVVIEAPTGRGPVRFAIPNDHILVEGA